MERQNMSEGFISRGFRGRRQQSDVAGRLPPGQYLERGFPVLSAGPTPHTPLERWDFSIGGIVKEPKRWTWQELLALPHETPTVDISCVTKWTKFDTHWEGVSVETLLQQVDYDPNVAHYVIASTKGNRWLPNMVGLRGCWFLISTSGRVPNGSEASAWSSGMHRASGSRLAITITETHGKNSATRATNLAAW
jgi:hypothetical protein